MIVEGTLRIGSLRETAVMKGKDTGWYSIKLNISDKTAAALEKEGVKVGSYEGHKQRGFKSKFPPTVVDDDGHPFSGEVPRGSLLRLIVNLGAESDPQYGTPTYFKKCKVLELGEEFEDEEGF